jgi:hypothetical protein
MTSQKVFPIEHSDTELENRAADLSRRIVEYDHKTGNGEELIKDSVLFNATYIELQNRKASRVSTLMTRLTWASACVAVVSLLVAWLSYDATRSADKWQEQQLSLLTQIANELSAVRKAQEQLLQTSMPLPSSKPSAASSKANPPFKRDALKRAP